MLLFAGIEILECAHVKATCPSSLYIDAFIQVMPSVVCFALLSAAALLSARCGGRCRCQCCWGCCLTRRSWA